MASAVIVCPECRALVDAPRRDAHMAGHRAPASPAPSRAKQVILSILAWTFLGLCFAMLGSAAWLLVRLAMRA